MSVTKLKRPWAEQLAIDVLPVEAVYIGAGLTNTTNVNGIYAVGDAATKLMVWPSAIASGAVTAAVVVGVGKYMGFGSDCWLTMLFIHSVLLHVSWCRD